MIDRILIKIWSFYLFLFMKKYCSYMKFDNLLENPSKTEKCPILASWKMLHGKCSTEQTPILESMMCTVRNSFAMQLNYSN